jgi:phosphoribosylformylglycinamidine (FGAM) synthase-like amidotransferase family enzyme
LPGNFTGRLPIIDTSKPKPKAAILREKGSNSEREMAHALYLAGFDVRDVHMTDLISGRETLPEDRYNIVAKYGYEGYPANPNGSDYNAAMIASADGRHLATMPHLERSMFPWSWANYPKGRGDEVSPWLEAFVNARQWIMRNG